VLPVEVGLGEHERHPEDVAVELDRSLRVRSLERDVVAADDADDALLPCRRYPSFGRLGHTSNRWPARLKYVEEGEGGGVECGEGTAAVAGRLPRSAAGSLPHPSAV